MRSPVPIIKVHYSTTETHPSLTKQLMKAKTKTHFNKSANIAKKKPRSNSSNFPKKKKPTKLQYQKTNKWAQTQHTFHITQSQPYWMQQQRQDQQPHKKKVLNFPLHNPPKLLNLISQAPQIQTTTNQNPTHHYKGNHKLKNKTHRTPNIPFSLSSPWQQQKH